MVICKKPHIAGHVKIGDDCLASDSVTFGITCQFSCDSGYHLAGNATSTCQADGSFSQQFPSCEKIVSETG